jgi:hypothetical protein
MTQDIETATESRINDNNNLIPPNTILVIPENESFNEIVNEVMHPLKGELKRDWFVKHAYFCLPLVIGNQYGFALKSCYDFEATWNGGDSPGDTSVIVHYGHERQGKQIISSHFGMGVITVQNRFHFRTPLGINLITLNAPNHFISNLQNMSGVIETDNLRRDFTFNLKITEPNVKITVKKGDFIGAILPVPRFTVENYELKLASELFSPELINNEIKMGQKFGVERSTVDINKPHGNGRRYFNGIDMDNNKFHEHQKRL